MQECDDDAYDTIAPVSQDVERQDEEEGCTNTHPDLNETLNYLSDNLGITSTQQNNEPLILDEMPDGEYRGLLQMLKARYTGKSVLKNYKLLNSGRLKTMRCELGALKLILLNELSIIETICSLSN